VFVLVFGVCGLGGFLSTNGNRIRCLLSDCSENLAGVPASWVDFSRVADEAAQKAASGAMLEGISASPLAEWPKEWSTLKTLKVLFRYVDPNGQTLYVDMNDTNPRETVDAWGPSVAPLMRSGSQYSAIGHQEYARLKADATRRRDVLSKVIVSPRQAEVLTWEEALAEARNDSTEIAPRIYLDLGHGPEDSSYVPTWRVQYSPVPTNGPPEINLRTFMSQSSAFIVDATTGEIMERETSDSFLSP
jgi:hypothetical protein